MLDECQLHVPHSERDAECSLDNINNVHLVSAHYANFRGCKLTLMPENVFTLVHLIELDFSDNCLARFPGALIAKELRHLEVIHLQQNKCFVLEDVLELSIMERLWALDLRQNPLRLLSNRIYFLETLFRSQSCTSSAIPLTDRQYKSKSREVAVMQAKSDAIPISYTQRLPRVCGFAMLQYLNGVWIDDREIQMVEKEIGKDITYHESKKPSKTSSSQVHGKLSAQFAIPDYVSSGLNKKDNGIPKAQSAARFQILCSENENSIQSSRKAKPSNLKMENQQDIQHVSEVLPLNFMTSLTSEERMYVRLQSMAQMGEHQQETATSFTKESAFFKASIFLDGAAQVGKSHRLLQFAHQSLSIPESNVMQKQNRKQYKRAEIARLHHETQKTYTRPLLDKFLSLSLCPSHSSPCICQEIEELAQEKLVMDQAVSKLKVNNALDVADLSNSQSLRRKRFLQQKLSKAEKKAGMDAHVFQEQLNHRHRLHLIATKQFASQTASSAQSNKRIHRFVSPWQERDYKAEIYRKSAKRESGKVLETLEEAKEDRLLSVNSQELLTRTAIIRLNANENLMALQNFWKEFQNTESEYEMKRHQEPIERIRRRLHARYHPKNPSF